MSQVVTGCSLHSKAVGIQILEEWRNSIHSLLVSLFSHQYSITSHQMALILMSLDPEGRCQDSNTYTCSLWPDMVTKISEQLLHDNGPAYSYPDMELFHWHWKKVKVWRTLRHGPLVIPPVFSITIHSFMYWRNNPFLTCPPVSKDSLDLGTFYPEQEIWPVSPFTETLKSIKGKLNFTQACIFLCF